MSKTDKSKLALSQFKLLRVLTAGTLVVASLSLLLVLFFYLRSKLSSDYTFYGDNPLRVVAFITVFIVLHYSLKRGFYKFTAVGLVFTYMFIGFYSSLRWGADVPFAFLIYALAVVLAGITMGGYYAIITNVVIICVLGVIIYLQKEGNVDFDYTWATRGLGLVDNVTVGLILSIISIVSWLSNKEIHSAFKLAQRAQNALLKEKGNLEARVAERTKEIERIQMERLVHIYRFVELGKISAGLIHEIVNPLSSVTVNLEQLDNGSINIVDKKQIRIALQRAIAGTREMENYIKATRRQIQKQEILKDFSVNEVINDCLKIFSYRMKTESILVRIDLPKNNQNIHGDMIKFHHLINNLISNSLDAMNDNRNNKILRITVIVRSGVVMIRVSDNGKGISKDDVNKIFHPFFTTKNEAGTGIGLTMSKDIVEKSFNGKIKVKSMLGRGTSFTVFLPLLNTK